jgi:hypothetical protein
VVPEGFLEVLNGNRCIRFLTPWRGKKLRLFIPLTLVMLYNAHSTLYSGPEKQQKRGEKKYGTDLC